MNAWMEFIKARVTMSRLSQREFADKCGVSEFAISNYFNGKRKPRLEIYEKMLDAVGYEIVLRPKDLITDK